MKIAIAQMQCSLGEVSANCSKIPLFARQAKEQGCGLIVFPEMIDTGYEMGTVVREASSWDGMPFEMAKRAAADSAISLVCGLSEREGERIYNSVAAFDPAGKLIGKYRKVHLLSFDPVNEDRYLAAGDSLATVDIGGMKWGLLICYDLRFPEMARHLMRKGCEGLIACAAWPAAREAHWKALTVARAIENQCYVIAANRVGSDGPLTFCGSSLVLDPFGSVVDSGLAQREELIIGEITPEAVLSLRSRLPILKDRRDDLYARWASD